MEESQSARARFHVVANKYVEVVLAFGSGKRRGKLHIAAPIEGVISASDFRQTLELNE